MFLFLHGLGASKSFWLPQIRGLLSLDQSYSDQTLLDLFTLPLPGHLKEDREFNLTDFEIQIREFAQNKGPLQLNLAQKLILTHKPELIAGLKEPKLTIIGHGAGAMLALEFSLRNLSWVHKLVLIGCGSNFNRPALAVMNVIFKLLFKLDLKQIRSLPGTKKNLRWKMATTLLAENPQRRGFKSLFQKMQTYDFQKLYSKASLNQQLSFIKIPILLINGRFDLTNTIFSVNKLAQILDPQNPILKTKKTIINPQTKSEYSNCEVRIYDSGHTPMDDDLVSFIYDTREFLKK